MLQHQIRQNADEVSNMLQSLGKWEKTMKSKDEDVRKAKNAKDGNAVRGVRSGAGTVRTSTNLASAGRHSTAHGSQTATKTLAQPETNSSEPQDVKAGSAAKHTYDVGYKKWEKFDIAAALDDDNNNDNDGDIEEFGYEEISSAVDVIEEVESEAVKRNKLLTPASLAMLAGSAGAAIGATKAVPKARGVHHNKEAETVEREQGNKEFAAGQFTQAVKSYTKCLGLKKRNYIAFSNRAMAYLKMKEYIRAEVDCNSALSIEPSHVKSLVRRATARNALGKHRAALRDLYAAMDLAQEAGGNTKQHRADVSKTQELLRQCVSRAPLVSVVAQWASEEEGVETGMQGPDLPSS